MNLAVWKYPLRSIVADYAIPDGGRFLEVQVQGDEPVMWWLVDPDAEKREWTIQVVGTGHREVEPHMRYMATYQRGWFVGHVFCHDEVPR